MLRSILRGADGVVVSSSHLFIPKPVWIIGGLKQPPRLRRLKERVHFFDGAATLLREGVSRAVLLASAITVRNSACRKQRTYRRCSLRGVSACSNDLPNSDSAACRRGGSSTRQNQRRQTCDPTPLRRVAVRYPLQSDCIFPPSAALPGCGRASNLYCYRANSAVGNPRM